jgi:hypothetical protein
MERKYWILLIIGLVVISAVLYGYVNQKDTSEFPDLNGIIKEAVGKPSMFGQFYLQKETGDTIILDSITRIDLGVYLEQEVTVQGFYENRTLNCDPRTQCANGKNYVVFFVLGVIGDKKTESITIKGKLGIEPKTETRYMLNGYWLIDGDEKLRDLVGKQVRVTGEIVESECDELDRLYPENIGRLQCMTGKRLSVIEVELSADCIGENEQFYYTGSPYKNLVNKTKIQNGCCAGLVRIDQYEYQNPVSMDATIRYNDGTYGSEITTGSYCTKCGDGHCKSPEDKLNCVEDCS